MRRIILLFMLVMIVLPSCSKRSGSTATMVKPKYHHRWYDRKKDKHTARTRLVKIRK